MKNPFDRVDNPPVKDSVDALYQWAFEYGHSEIHEEDIYGPLNDDLQWLDCIDLGILERTDGWHIRLREGFQDRIQEVLDERGIKL